jgi:hypothetical protein
MPWGPRRGDGGPRRGRGERGWGSAGAEGSVLLPPSSSDVPGTAGTRIASSFRIGIHSISAAIGSLTTPTSSTTHIHRGISSTMLLLLRAIG